MLNFLNESQKNEEKTKHDLITIELDSLGNENEKKRPTFVESKKQKQKTGAQ